MIELNESFAILRKRKDSLIEVRKFQGEVFRELETRRTLRFGVASKSCFLKWHRGTTYKEVIKNLLSLRMSVLGTDREWNAIHRLASLGVDTMYGVAFGETGWNPVKKTSFIITEDLTPTISLEDYCASWCVEPPHPHVKRMLIQRVVDMVRAMHLDGVNHCDCYICHFLFHLPFDDKNEDSLKISVIDLYRAQIRSKVPLRWCNKDLIGLYFSSDNIGLMVRDYCRFLKIYFNRGLKDIIKNEGVFIEQVEGKARSIRERTIRKSL